MVWRAREWAVRSQYLISRCGQSCWQELLFSRSDNSASTSLGSTWTSNTWACSSFFLWSSRKSDALSEPTKLCAKLYTQKQTGLWEAVFCVAFQANIMSCSTGGIETFSTSHANAKRNVKRLHLRWSYLHCVLPKITNKTVVSFCGIQEHDVICNVFCWVLRFASQMLKVSDRHGICSLVPKAIWVQWSLTNQKWGFCSEGVWGLFAVCHCMVRMRFERQCFQQDSWTDNLVGSILPPFIGITPINVTFFVDFFPRGCHPSIERFPELTGSVWLCICVQPLLSCFELLECVFAIWTYIEQHKMGDDRTELGKVSGVTRSSLPGGRTNCTDLIVALGWDFNSCNLTRVHSRSTSTHGLKYICLFKAVLFSSFFTDIILPDFSVFLRPNGI